MTPEAAVALLATIVAGRAEFTEDEVYEAMTAAGVSESVADRTYKFTQIAWGRVFLSDLGIDFPSNYICFNGNGEVIESGPLSGQPYFAAAAAMANECGGTPGFQRLALMAAEVQAVNELLLKGSDPRNLQTSPPALFLEPATPAGLERAQKYLLQSLGANKTRKPWWQFW